MLLSYSSFVIWSVQCVLAVQSLSSLLYNTSIFITFLPWINWIYFLSPTMKLKHKTCLTMTRDFFLLLAFSRHLKIAKSPIRIFLFFLVYSLNDFILVYYWTDKLLVPIITLLSYTLLTHPCYCSFLLVGKPYLI